MFNPFVCDMCVKHCRYLLVSIFFRAEVSVKQVGGEVLLLDGACGLEMEPQAVLRFGNLKGNLKTLL